MAVTIPGLSLSILRQATQTQAGQPVLISGRFSAFGLGLPTLIRINLTGPSYNPETVHFDTFSAPFTGDYNVQVVPAKDGQYTVSAQAYPLPPVPTTPLTPQTLLPFPPIAESEQPPLVVGVPIPGGVSAQLPGGATTLPTPPPTPIEIQVAVGAPSVSISIPGAGAPAYPSLPFLPTMPTPPAVPTPAVPAAPGAKAASIDDVRMIPDTISVNQVATGFVSWRNMGTGIGSFNVNVFLVSPTGVSYGPLQSLSGVRAFPGNVITTPIQLNTPGLAAGKYDVTVEIRDPDTGSLVNTRTFTGRLTIGAPVTVPAPSPPTVPTPPTMPTPPTPPTVPTPPTLSAPTFPQLPTRNMLGTPGLVGLPQQLTKGDIWKGNISMPTVIPTAPSGFQQLLPGAPQLPQYTFNWDVSLEDSRGFLWVVTMGTTAPQLGQLINIPINFNTGLNYDGQTLPTDRFNIILSVRDNSLNQLWSGSLGSFYLMAPPTVPTPTLPAAPAVAPTLPTAAMFGTPNSINLASQIDKGALWSGDISLPTQWPSALPVPPSLPAFPVGLVAQLRSPSGSLIDVANVQPSFTPGQAVNIPISFDSSNLPEAGTYSLNLIGRDLQGNLLFSDFIRNLQVAFPAVPVPPAPPAPPAPTPIYNIWTQVDPPEAGTVSLSPPGLAGFAGNAYEKGSSVALTAKSKVITGIGWYAYPDFQYWDVDGEWLDSNPTINVPVLRDHTYTAHFTYTPAPVSVA